MFSSEKKKQAVNLTQVDKLTYQAGAGGNITCSFHIQVGKNTCIFN